MSVAYEPRSFLHEGTFPPMGDEPDHADPRFDSEVAEHLSHYTSDAAILSDDRGVMGDERDMLVEDDAVIHDASQLDLDVGEFPSPLHVPLQLAMHQPMSEVKLTSAMLQQTHPHAHAQPMSHQLSQTSSHPSSSFRVKPIPKPDREVHKDVDGRFHCTLEGCNEETRSFLRRCEWNKHMDKHERPYRCPADGCENLPGFTYSGGLLRHEREVHGKHGGPKKTVNCPHPNCKRHTGKGFSRQENLNEHLRRVHTNMDETDPPDEAVSTPRDDDSVPSANKRKRDSISIHHDELTELREELKRVKQENQELKVQVEQQALALAQLSHMSQAVRQSLGTPNL